MASTKESLVKTKVHAILKDAGAYAVNYIGGVYAKAGTPDILVCLHGMFIGIECKAGKNKPTALQINALEKIEQAGGLALVINESNISYLYECVNNIHTGEPLLSNYREFK